MSGNTRAGWRKLLARVTPRDREELALLLGGLAPPPPDRRVHPPGQRSPGRRNADLRQAHPLGPPRSRQPVAAHRPALAPQRRARYHRARQRDRPRAGRVRCDRFSRSTGYVADGYVRLRGLLGCVVHQSRAEAALRAAAAGRRAAPARSVHDEFPERPRAARRPSSTSRWGRC